MWTIVFAAITSAHVHMGGYPTKDLCQEEISTMFSESRSALACKFVPGLKIEGSARRRVQGSPSLVRNPRVNPMTKPQIYLDKSNHRER